MIAKQELNALIYLLDDPDREVNHHVCNKLASLGNGIVPSLYEAWEITENVVQQRKIEEIIHNIQYDDTLGSFTEWLELSNLDLLEGLLIVSRLRFPDVNEYRIVNELNRIKRAIWLEMGDFLSPLEQINIFNHVFFKNIGFTALEEEFDNPDSYFLSRVVESKRGNPLSVGVIYQAIARSLNIPVYGVELPKVFILSFLKYEQNETDLIQGKNERETLFYINPMNNGLIFTRHEIKKYLCSIDIKPESKHFTPISTMRMLKLLLVSLKHVYLKQKKLQSSREVDNFIKLVPA